ncbi:hypothetical protein KKF81_07410 [Candidatus Micrarchaeota archaeon]|nr:hypothetical protein [Candidatus Micrarchaeota archaeon]MBU1166757.1 hypothetical protein [Candidatus Micrarchaeota archaeon]MBU1887245.1 hypothetical protein [Candidatus Micrarchaeota archaeon]
MSVIRGKNTDGNEVVVQLFRHPDFCRNRYRRTHCPSSGLPSIHDPSNHPVSKLFAIKWLDLLLPGEGVITPNRPHIDNLARLHFPDEVRLRLTQGDNHLVAVEYCDPGSHLPDNLPSTHDIVDLSFLISGWYFAAERMPGDAGAVHCTFVNHDHLATSTTVTLMHSVDPYNHTFNAFLTAIQVVAYQTEFL